MKWWKYWGLVLIGFVIGAIGWEKHYFELYGAGIAIMFYTVGFFNGRKNNKEKT
jgi:hypothetical protein